MPRHSSNKRTHGQYFTVGNPFVLEPFIAWFSAINISARQAAIEPFAGAGNIPSLMHDAGFEIKWSCFDIDPPSTPLHPVKTRNTLTRFPKGFSLGITNPPYLARNSATRRGLSWAGAGHDDLYLHALEKMLDHIDYVAVIIPESFITRSAADPRLHAVVSLPWRMFHDTDHPVCLALFNPTPCAHPDGYAMFSANEFIGRRHVLERLRPSSSNAHPWVFNDPKGSIGLRSVDNAKSPSIIFQFGHLITSEDVKSSSRALTRISGVPPNQASAVISRANDLLSAYRTSTRDVFMTSFKGLRADGRYRRRLDYAAARALLNKALEEAGI